MPTIRVMPELQAGLDAMPSSDALTFLLTDHGRPFKSAAAFGNKFADWCRAAGLEGGWLRPWAFHRASDGHRSQTTLRRSEYKL